LLCRWSINPSISDLQQHKNRLSKGNPPIFLLIQQAAEKMTGKHPSFFWIPSVLVFIGLEVGANRIKIGQTIHFPKNNLGSSLRRQIDVVHEVLSEAKDLGFEIFLDKDTEDEVVVACKFSKIFPSNLYYELSLMITRFLRFESNF
jgi:hypothetical protein